MVNRKGPLPERFWQRVDKTGDCWLWTGHTGRGYGRLTVHGKYTMAHRYAYELLVGPIPEGLTLDHLCRNRACVNPAHLEPVTNRENILRGEGAAAKAARRTHCPAGHSYDRITSTTGVRRCRQCERDGQYRRYWAKRKRQAA